MRCRECLCCGIARPFAEGAVADFYRDTYSSAAPWELHKAAVLARDYLEKVRPFVVSGSRPLTMLEVGAGYGFFSKLVVERYECRVDIVEPSAVCRDSVRRAPDGIRTVFSSMDEVPVEDIYDTIFSFH